MSGAAATARFAPQGALTMRTAPALLDEGGGGRPRAISSSISPPSPKPIRPRSRCCSTGCAPHARQGTA